MKVRSLSDWERVGVRVRTLGVAVSADLALSGRGETAVGALR
jgi:hypothetical protein